MASQRRPRTHFKSITDGSRDGAPTFFEVPLTSTKRVPATAPIGVLRRGFKAAYGGVVLKTEWDTSEKGITDATLALIAAVAGSVIGVVVIAYLWMLKVYA
uniref:Uncharacterized protein n=1 Tax=Chromera velia CCMP2878 TaxID=1169474 RepID=A0A0G4HWU0_9ALVE|eukprot:Cvel_1451.t1-p1 / transcript=Cvel_1451.t1 / gene=Cvel_1451 / organism=Chromera_velia_CCMP2878 / gene_product=hypothetical protein / transcript_product=hypothetical protein / location=Cvel_scaffold51:4998-11640(+) / protein_length=100 / sequence_SO=supercontig / SO=protein_coding / is_pseudo=false